MGLIKETRFIIKALWLDSNEAVAWRRSWIRIIELAEEYDFDQYTTLMGHPDNLPDLKACKPPKNAKPEGIVESFLKKQEEGKLEATYLY